MTLLLRKIKYVKLMHKVCARFANKSKSAIINMRISSNHFVAESIDEHSIGEDKTAGLRILNINLVFILEKRFNFSIVGGLKI